MKKSKAKSLLLFFPFILVLICINSFSINDIDSERVYTVSQDGKEDFKTIQDAVNAVEDDLNSKTKIIIKKGTYREKITIPATKGANVLTMGIKRARKTVLPPCF